MSTSKNIKSTNGKGARQSTKGKPAAKNDYNQLLTGFLILVLILAGLWFFISNQSQKPDEKSDRSVATLKSITVEPTTPPAVDKRKITVELSEIVKERTQVKLASSRQDLLKVDSYAYVEINQKQTTVTATCKPVSSNQNVDIKVTLGKNSATESIQLNPPTQISQVSSLTFSFRPDAIAAGRSSTGTLSLNQVAESDVQINLTSNAEYVKFPAQIKILAGQQTGTFDAKADAAAKESDVNITASMETVKVDARLKVTKSELKVTEYAGWVVPVTVISLIIACSSLGFSLVLFFSKREPSETVDYESIVKSHTSGISRELNAETRNRERATESTKSELESVRREAEKLRKQVTDLETHVSTAIRRFEVRIADLGRFGPTPGTTQPTPNPIPIIPSPPPQRPTLRVEEQLILDNINHELQQPAVLIGKVMKLTYKWCLFSEALKSEIRTTLLMHNFEIIEPKAGEKFDSTTMEYETLPYNCKYLVREVEMLGVRDLRSTGLLCAMVVVE